MTRSHIKPFVAALGLFAAASTANALQITEHFDNSTGEGSYSVTVEGSDPGGLIGFGVSNTATMASVESYGSNFGCQNNAGFAFIQICYDALTLTAANWGSETENFTGETFQNLFGDFSLNVEAGEDTINWYGAVDGDLQPGDATSDNFFLFSGAAPASIGTALFSGNSGLVVQTGIPVSLVAPPPPPSGVPAPAGILLMLGGLAAMRLRRKP